MPVSIKQILPKEAIDFKKQIFSNKDLVQDGWDSAAEHFGCFSEDILMGVVRIVQSTKNELPLSQFIPHCSIENDDREVSRFALLPEYRKSKNMREFLYWINDYTQKYKTLYANVLKKNIKPSHFSHQGFTKTDFHYLDPRYDLESVLMVRKK